MTRLRPYLTNPRLLAHRVALEFRRRLRPDEPWLHPRAIAFCDGYLTYRMHALEWGSGRSTSWIARRVERLISVEHDAAWYELVRGRLEAHGCTNVDYRLIAAEPGGHTNEPMTSVPAYVAVAGTLADDSLDFVLVDGLYRPMCVLAAKDKLRGGGVLLVDDTQQMAGLETLLPGWREVFRVSTAVSQSIAWEKPA